MGECVRHCQGRCGAPDALFIIYSSAGRGGLPPLFDFPTGHIFAARKSPAGRQAHVSGFVRVCRVRAPEAERGQAPKTSPQG